jgi:epoxyqueuosine reductase
MDRAVNKKELTDRIKSKALDVGFNKVGIARADEVTSASLLQKWLASGFQGTMKWMLNRQDERNDPRKYYPGARSVVSVALNYNSPQKISSDPDIAKISRYAWGDDYHDIMKDKLHLLLDEIKSICPEAKGICCVDTSPVMDKYWAVQAGIGWQGKHSNVITRELGSWVFLGEIIINIELEYDQPIEDFCGTCNRCIEACPTDAITQPYVVDSNKCISYLTIEYRGESFPKETERSFGGWIYGCDICQDVCPWNEKFAQPTTVEGFHPREENVNRKTESWVQLSEDEFRKRFKNSPVKRTKYAGFMRNVKQVLSNFMKR